MKRFIFNHSLGKFNRFMKGFIFAIFSTVALLLCVFYMKDNDASKFKIIIPFCIALVSMSLGFISMFKPSTLH